MAIYGLAYLYARVYGGKLSFYTTILLNRVNDVLSYKGNCYNLCRKTSRKKEKILCELKNKGIFV